MLESKPDMEFIPGAIEGFSRYSHGLTRKDDPRIPKGLTVFKFPSGRIQAYFGTETQFEIYRERLSEDERRELAYGRLN